MKAKGVGILGLGLALPEKVRTNGEWPPEYLEQFKARHGDDIGKRPSELTAETDLPREVRITLEEMAKFESDPFRGSVERRVMDPAMKPSDLEALAAREALQNAGLAPKDVDLLFVTSLIPDQIVPLNGGAVHHKVGLHKRTAAIAIDMACGGFLNQIQLGASCVASGNAKYILMVQSGVSSLYNDLTNPQSATFGDAATAAVLGPVAADRGLLGSANFFDGSFRDGAVLTPEGEIPWYRGGGPLRALTLDKRSMKKMVTSLGTQAREAVDAALEEAHLCAGDVGFYATHQSMPFFNAVCGRAANLTHARTMDTYAKVGSVMSAAIPTNLYFGQKEGLLRDGDVTVLFTVGAGLSWAASVLRWGP